MKHKAALLLLSLSVLKRELFLCAVGLECLCAQEWFQTDIGCFRRIIIGIFVEVKSPIDILLLLCQPAVL